jgi:carbonic anhydrase
MAAMSANDQPSPTAAEALQRLVDGNERFLRGESRNTRFCLETLANLAAAQRPYATILGCADSRVAPEMIFDAGLGELFVIQLRSTPEVKMRASEGRMMLVGAVYEIETGRVRMLA